MKSVLLCTVLLITFGITKEAYTQCPLVSLANFSFEGVPQMHVQPSPWIECMSGETPDTQPGIWGINLPPTHGSSYLGLVCTPSYNWHEGVSQQLSSPLVAGLSYKLILDIANVFTSDIGVGIEPGCAELQIWGGFFACDENSGNLLWSSGNITPYDTWITDTATLYPMQNYTWIMFRINGLGCTDGPYILVDNIRPISAYYSPALNISDSTLLICPGTGVTIGGTLTPYCVYSWTGGGLNSSDVNPVVSPTTNTIFSVELTDTITGCKTLGNVTVEMNIPQQQEICVITVDPASTHNIIIWEKLDKAGTDSFYVYREVSTNNYYQIAAIHSDSLSEYHDYGANPNVTSYRYKISTRDTCFNEGVLSSYHNTIHLKYLGLGNLLWNVYEIENQITPVSTFDVYCDTVGSGNWQILATVPGTQYAFTDILFSSHPNARYRISSNFSYSCTPTRSVSSSLSNIISISGTDIIVAEQEGIARLFPNPARDELYVFTSGYPIESMMIFAIDGKLLFESKHVTSNTFDVSGFAPGIYISNVLIASVSRRIKWVKL